MGQETLSKFENSLIYLSQYVVVIVVAIVSLVDAETGAEIALILFISLAFAGLASRLSDPRVKRSKQIAARYLALQTVVVIVALTFLSTLLAILFFVMSVHVMMTFPTKQALGWISVFILITTWAYVANQGWVAGLLNTLVNGAGYLFFGAFGNALARIEQARQESQQLFGELQTAHQQLQAYTDQVEVLAVSEERNRLSRDLHDTLGHRLTVSIVQLEGAERLVKQEPDRARVMINTVREQLKEGLAEVRQTVALLRTPLTTDLSLPKALRQLQQSFQTATDLQVTADIPDDLPALPDSYRLALYRVAQEGLTNIQRHAQAQNVWLSLQVVPKAISLTLRDDGLGFTQNESEGGFGLRGMKERAAQLQGTMEINGYGDRGTTLHFQLPLPAKEVKHADDTH
ncbi:MAG: sensor histidine kinase [Chloroflexota bacterium]